MPLLLPTLRKLQPDEKIGIAVSVSSNPSNAIALQGFVVGLAWPDDVPAPWTEVEAQDVQSIAADIESEEAFLRSSIADKSEAAKQIQGETRRRIADLRDRLLDAKGKLAKATVVWTMDATIQREMGNRVYNSLQHSGIPFLKVAHLGRALIEDCTVAFTAGWDEYCALERQNFGKALPGTGSDGASLLPTDGPEMPGPG